MIPLFIIIVNFFLSYFCECRPRDSINN